MTSSVRLAAVALAIAGLASQAQAINADLGTIVPDLSLSFEQTAASFTDTYAITVGDVIDFEFSFTNLGLGSNARISVALNGNEIVGAFGRNIVWQWGPFGTPPFASGTEFLVSITGTDNSLDTASYVFGISSASLAPIPAVPEPQAWALMAGGLLGVGVWCRRRTQG